MHAVFILPPYEYMQNLGSRRRMMRGVLPSLGVGYLAGAIEAHGHTASLVDAQIAGLTAAETAEEALAQGPDVVGISSISAYAQSAYAVAAELKARRPELLIVMGGPHATSARGRILEQCPSVDLLFAGEAERSFAEFLDKQAQGLHGLDVPGIIYRGEKGIVETGPPPSVALDELPMPSRALYDPYPYRPLPNQARREPATTVITSRGCSWGKCTFCHQSRPDAPKFRRRSPENVVQELRYLAGQRGIREIVFWDDTFLVNEAWVTEFCEALEAANLGLTWSCYGRANAVTQAMLRRIAAAGCYNVYYGFESGVQEVLDMVHKGENLEEMRQAVRWTKACGMETRGSFILGFPTETPEMVRKTVRFACELNADWMLFFPFRMLPGTAIEHLARQEGRVLELESEFPTYVSNSFEDLEELHRLVRWAYRKYYLRPRYLARALWNCRRPYALRNYIAAFGFWIDMALRSPKTFG